MTQEGRRHYVVVVSVPEVLIGTSYFQVCVEADSDEEAARIAEATTNDGNAEFLGFAAEDNEASWHRLETEKVFLDRFPVGTEVLVCDRTTIGRTPKRAKTSAYRTGIGHRCPTCGYMLVGDRWLYDSLGYEIEYPDGDHNVVAEEDLEAVPAS